MIEFGKTLREAREAKGYTISQIAEATHMLSSIVQCLEEEDFSKIVAPIYGRGFVKLYCETVGLESKPLINEFMEIYNGRRDPLIKERPVATAEQPTVPPVPAEEPIPAPEPPPLAATIEPAPEPPPPLFERPVEPAPEPPSIEPDLFNLPPEKDDEPPQNRGLSKYASPLRERARDFSMPKISLPPNFWRMIFLCIILLVLLAAIGFGIRALYRATTDLPAPQTADTTEAPKPAAKPVSNPSPAPTPDAKPNRAVSTNRTPQEIPSLYID